MLIVAIFAVGLLALRLSGADLSRLDDLGLRWGSVALVAVLTQVAIISVWPGGWRLGHLLVNLGTYAMIGAFLWVNRHVAWLWVVAVGTASNALAITLNGGVMPASAAALRAANRSPGPGFANSAPVAHARLQFLGDVFASPSWIPLHNVASVGDLLIVTGALLLVASQTRRRHDHATEAGSVGRGPRVL